MSSRSNTGGFNVFVSYRRSDAPDAARLIKLGILLQRGDYDVFFDRDSIEGGRDFAKEIGARIENADVVLAVIGAGWASDDGLRQLTRDGDWVRRELEAALKRGVPIIPVTVKGASVPSGRDLPDSLKHAFRLNKVPIHDDSSFDHSIERLVQCLEEIKREGSAQPPATNDDAAEEPEAAGEPQAAEGPRAARESEAVGEAEAAGESETAGVRPPDYVLATRAALNGGSIDLSARELLQLFGRQHLTETARAEIQGTFEAGGLRCQPKPSRLLIDDRVRVTREKEVPEFHLRARVDSEGPVTIPMAELVDLFGHRRLSNKTRDEIEKCLRYVGLMADPRVMRADKDGIVVVSEA